MSFPINYNVDVGDLLVLVRQDWGWNKFHIIPEHEAIAMLNANTALFFPILPKSTQAYIRGYASLSYAIIHDHMGDESLDMYAWCTQVQELLSGFDFDCGRYEEPREGVINLVRLSMLNNDMRHMALSSMSKEELAHVTGITNPTFTSARPAPEQALIGEALRKPWLL